MTRPWLTLWLILCPLLSGAGCAAQPLTADCEPEIIVQEVLKPLPPDLLIPQPCPSVPRAGDLQVLLDWAENCAIAARLANDQLDAIRALQD